MPDNKDKKVATLQGMDNSNADISTTLESNQSQFDTNINTPRTIPDIIGPSIQGSPKVGGEETKTSFLDDAVNTFSDKNYTPNAQSGSTFLGHQLPGDATSGRFPNYLVGADNEDIYGEKQSGLEKLASTVPRMVGTFSKTLLQGVTAPIAGLGYLATGGNFINNDYNKWLEKWDDTENKLFPLYESNKEKNVSFLGQLKYGNSYVHLMEFLAMGAGLATTGVVTAGIGEALGGAAVTRGITSSYINAITKISEIAPELAELDNGKAITTELITKINKIASASIGEGNKMEAMTASIKEISDKYLLKSTVWNSTKQKAYGAASLLGMNAGMGAKAQNDFEANLTQKYIDKNQVAPNDEEKVKIHEMANKVGEWTFGVGTLMSTISLGGLFKGVLAKNDADEFLMNKIANLTEKTSEAKGELGVTKYAAKALPFEGATSKFGKAIQWSGNKSYKFGKLIGKVVDPWAGFNLAEFSMLGPSVENYYNKKYETGQADLMADAIGPNAQKMFTTKEGWSTFFMGMIGAGPMEIGRKIKEGKQLGISTNDAITSFNDLNKSAHNYLIDNNEAIIRGKSLQDEYVEATESNDNLAKYNIKQAKLINYLFPRVKHGMKNLVEKDLDGYRKIAETDEGIQKLQDEGILPKTGDPKVLRENFGKYLDNISLTANNMETYYKAATMRYGGIMEADGKTRMFKDEHIQKMMYLSGMTDDATERMKTLIKDLQTSSLLQETYHRINTSVNKNEGGFEETNIDKLGDLQQLLTAESKSSIIDKEGDKVYLAGELYDGLVTRIKDLQVVQTQKDELQEKLNDLVQLNFLRKNYLKQYNDILHNPKRYTDESPTQLLNPYTEDYVGKDDVLEVARTYDSLNNNLEVETKYGKKPLTIGEEYYAGKPIVVRDTNGVLLEEGFRKFKIIRELPEEGKILIKTDEGKLIPVDKDFLKNHDVSRSRNINRTGSSKFYNKNKRKRLIRKVEKSKIDPDHIEKQKTDLLAEKDTHIKHLTNSHNQSKKSLERTLAKLTKDFEQYGSDRNKGEEISREIQLVQSELAELSGKSSHEAARITGFYNSKIKQLEELAKESEDPKSYLDNKAKASYATALDQIEQDYNNKLNKLNEDVDKGPSNGGIRQDDYKEQKTLLDELKQKQTTDLKTKYRDLYNKRLKEINEGQEEMGTLEYSPSKDQLHFIDGKGKETDIDLKDFKDGKIKKADGTAWDVEDKDFFENADKLKTERQQLDFLASQTVTLEKALEISDDKNYNEPSKVFYEEFPNDKDKELKQNEANAAIQKLTGKPTGAKKPINIAVRSSIVLDSKYLLSKYPELKTWLERRNNWAERFNTFTARILEPLKTSFWKNSDLKDKAGNYKQPSVVFVHPGNQDALGLKGLILPSDIAYQNTKKLPAPIYIVYIHTDENNKKWTIDNNGKKLKEIGIDHTEEQYNTMVFTARPSDLAWDNGVAGYQDASTEDIKKYTELFDKETSEILSSTAEKPIQHEFKVSNGKLQEPKGVKRRTAISQTGLVDEESLSYPLVQIGTTGAGITIGEKKIETPAGIPYMVRGTSVQVLDAKRFGEKDKNHIYKCLNWLAETWLLPDVKNDPHAERKSFKQTVNDYLASVIFLNHKFVQKPSSKELDKTTAEYNKDGYPSNRYENQISIANRLTSNPEDNLPYLMLGKTTRILFTPKSLEENKQVIKDFLDKTHHVTLNKLLLAEGEKHEKGRGDIKYREITDFDTNGLPIMATWDSYTKYLTSSKDISGNERKDTDIPLTLNVDKPIDGNLPVEGMYITIQKAGEKLEVVKKPEIEKPDVKSTSVDKVSPVNISFDAFKDKDSKVITSEVKLDGSENIFKTNHETYGDVHYTADVRDGQVDVTVTKVLNISDAEKELLTDAVAKEQMNIRFTNMKNSLTKKIQDQLDSKKTEEKAIAPIPKAIPEVKKEENTVSKIEASDAVAEAMIKRRNKKKGTDSTTSGPDTTKKNMIVSELQKGVPLENIQAFKDFMTSVLPTFPVKDFPYMLRNGQGGYSFGQYDHAYKTVLLGVDAIEGTGFHEAFHAVWESFLSPKEQRALIDEFKYKTGEYIDRFGTKHNYSDLHTEDQIIEQLADEFREHNLANKVYEKSPVKMSFFTRLKNFIKNFFGLDKAKSLDQVMDRINAGYYKDASFYNRKTGIKDMIRFPDGSKITQQTVRDFSSGIINTINKYISADKGGLSYITEGRVNIDEVLSNVKEHINEQINNPDEKFSDDQVREFSRIIQPLCDILTDDDGPYYKLNDKKWEYLVENKLKDKIKSTGLKTIKVDEEVNSELPNTDSETGNSSVTDDTTEEATKDTNKSPYGADIFKINAKETAPKEIQFVFNTLVDVINESVPGYNKDLISPKEQTNSLLFNKIVEDNSLFYKTMHSLSYSSTIGEMEDKFKELAKTVPALVAPYKFFFGVDSAARTPAHWKMLTRLFKTFSKYSPENIMQRRDDSGKSYVTSSNADTIINIMSKKWESNFKGNAKVSLYDAETKSYKVNPNFKFTKTKTADSRFEFLREIGFTGISRSQYDSFTKDNKDSALESNFSKVVDKIYEGVIKFQKSGQAILGKDIFETGKSIGKLAEIAADMAVDKASSQFQRLDKEFVQTHINQNFYARVIGAVRNSLNIKDFLVKNERLASDVYNDHSLLFGKAIRAGKESNLFKADGTPKNIGLVVDNGSVDENGNRTLLTDMTNIQRTLYSLNGLLRGRTTGTGIFQMFAPADQTTDFGMEMDHYISMGDYKSTDKTTGKVAKFHNIMKGYLEDEINLIGDAENRMKYEELAKVVNGTPRAKQLRYFKDILAKGTSDKIDLAKLITDYANKEADYTDTKLSFTEFLDSSVNIGTKESPINAKISLLLKEKIDKHLDKEIKDFVETLFSEGALETVEKNGMFYYKFSGLNTDFLGEFGISRRKFENEPDVYLFSQHEINNILEFATMNYKIHNIELSKLFYSDPANYKDFLKRSKMYNSGTELHFHSEEYNTQATNNLNSVKSGDKEVKLQPGDPSYRKFTNNLKGITYNHGEKKTGTNVISKSIDFIKSFIKDPKAIKEYETNNNEIDAQSHMSLDAKRELALKNGTWTDRHEELFQYQKAQQRLNRQSRLESNEQGLRDKLFLDKERTNYYHSDSNKLGDLSKRGKELKAIDEELVKHPLVGKEYLGLFNVEKPLGAGFSDNKTFNSPNGLKTSTMPLVYSTGMAGSALDDLDMFMEKHGIDYAGPTSQQKFGRLNKTFDLYNITNSFDNFGKLALHELSSEVVNDGSYYQPFENFNKIVETATRHDEGTIGTQLRVQSTVDMMDSGLPRDFFNKENGQNFADQKAKWDIMSKEQKKSASEMYRLHSEMNDTLKGMINKAKPQVYTQLGIGTVDGKLQLKHPDRLLSYLKEMTNTYNIPANLRDAIKITQDKEGNDVIRLDQLPNRQSLEYIINSAIEKYVVRPKMNGGPKIMVSGAMWEKNGRSGAYYDKKDDKWITVDTKEKYDRAKTEGHKIILTSNDLKFYRTEDGKTQGMEIKVNNHFKEKMLEWAKTNSKEIVSDEQLLKYLQTNEGKDLLTGVGFRIPSQGLNSFDVFKIVGFTDDSLGDVVVVPSEITTKSGADFDVDKLNTYIKNFYLDEQGLPKLVKFYDKINEDTLEKIWEQAQYLKGEELTDLSSEEMLDTTFDDSTSKEIREKELQASRELQTLEKFIADNKHKDPFEVNSREAIHNHYFDTLSSVILHDSNMEKVLTPNSTHLLENVDNEMSKVTHNDQGKSDNINYSNYLNMVWVNQKRQEMLEAKNATSISASSVTSHAMMQTFPYHLNPDIHIKLPHEKITVDYNGERKEVTTLSSIKNKAGQFISEVLSQIVNTTVDAVNNPILMRLLPSIDAFSPSLFLLRAGVEPKFVFFFLKQPIIAEYIKLKNRNKQLSDERKLSAKKIQARAMEAFSGGESVKDLDQFDFTNDSNTGLKDMLAAWTDRKEFLSDKGKENQRKGFSDTKKSMQRAILAEYLTYEKLANELFEQQQGSYYGNMKKATNNSIWLKKNIFRKASENPNFIGLHDNMEDSWHGVLRNTVNELSDGLSSVLFKTTDRNAVRQIAPAMDYIANLFIKGGEKEKNKLLNRVKSNFLDFLVHNFGKDKTGKSLNEEISRLTLGESSLANRLQDIQEALEQIKVTDPTADILNNAALKKLMAVISNPKNPRMINIEIKPSTVNEKEDFTSSLEELKEHPGIPHISLETGEFTHIDLQAFYEDFVKLGILQSGTSPSRTSWNELTPEEDYEHYTSQSIEALEDNHSLIQQYDKLKVFWRTNFGDDRLVPGWFRNTGAVGNKKNRKILKDGSLVVTLQAKNKEGELNTYSPVVKVKRPIYLTVTENDKTITRQATKSELAKIRNNNEDFKENLYETEGYQQVLDQFGDPVIVTEVESGKSVDKYLYKPINLWGDGRNMTEFYTEVKPSVLDKNIKVDEMSDEEFIDHYEKGNPQIIEDPNNDHSTDIHNTDDLSAAELAEIEMYTRGQEQEFKPEEERYKELDKELGLETPEKKKRGRPKKSTSPDSITNTDAPKSKPKKCK